MQYNQLLSVLQAPYQRTPWISVLDYLTANNIKRLKDTLQPRDLTARLNATDQKTLAALFQIGTFITSEGELMPIFEATLQPHVRIDRNRVQVNDIIKRLIMKDVTEAALCVFHYGENTDKEWRFSFIRQSVGSDFFGDEADDTTETNPKRFTYIFGTPDQHRTARQRLQALRESNFTLDAFQDAFAIEALSKDFFAQYRDVHYQKFVEHLSQLSTRNTHFTAQDSDKEIRDFVKKMLGRIVFLYFVQKKGWLGASTTDYTDGDLNFMQHYFEAAGQDEGFYPNHLTRLFFGALNTPRPQDDFTLPDGRIVKVPYLNGGLFDVERESYQHLSFPPLLFEELFAFLNAYNFTVYENSPDDHVVAVDPEMLGNIFENLLEDNKDKGAFYTPKEVVQYMCQQSIIEYLHTQVDAPKAALEAFVKLKNEAAAAPLRPHAEALDGALDRVKICDPAIGSGAFPMGLLQEIFDLKIALHQLLGIALPTVEGGDYQDQYATVKAHIIQHSIYGVDIEKGAVDIAHLRFWLALVVDEARPKPLPNLDYKIIVGDSLRPTFKGELLRIDWGKSYSVGTGQAHIAALRDHLGQYIDLQRAYFAASDHRKDDLKAQIRITKIQLLLAQLRYDLERYKDSHPHRGGLMPSHKDRLHNLNVDGQLTTYRKHIQQLEGLIQQPDQPVAYFDWWLDCAAVLHPMLQPQGRRPGFDIVIGNPPYIQLQQQGGRLADQYETMGYTTFERTGDIYALFYERGFQLLREGGIHTFITSNKWMRAKYGKSLRAYFSKQNPLRLIDLGPGVFPNATVDTNILIAQKAAPARALQSVTVQRRQQLNHLAPTDFVPMPDIDDNTWTVLDATATHIKQQIERLGTPLKDWDINIYRGILTGYNEAFVITTAQRNALIAQDPRSQEVIKPLLRGKDIKRYRAEWADLWLIFVPWHFPLHGNPSIKGASKEAEEAFQRDYPVLYSHLQKHEDKLRKRNKAETGIRYEWYALQRAAASYYEEFQKEKIVWGNLTLKPNFCIDDSGALISAPTNLLTINKGNIKALTALMNAKVFEFYMKLITYSREHGYMEFKKVFVEQVPVIQPSREQEAVLSTLVDYLLEVHRATSPIDAYVTNAHLGHELERVIDACVYELYFGEAVAAAGASLWEEVEATFRPWGSDASTEERQAVIRAAYESFQEVHSPIRNRITLQNLHVAPIRYINSHT